MGFTGKEADEDVGLVYFGERYLLARLGRWASPDPLHVHASGGGEALNSYHYLSGNLLQGRDPLGLEGASVSRDAAEGEEAARASRPPDEDPHPPYANVAEKAAYELGREYGVSWAEAAHLNSAGRAPTDGRREVAAAFDVEWDEAAGEWRSGLGAVSHASERASELFAIGARSAADDHATAVSIPLWGEIVGGVGLNMVAEVEARLASGAYSTVRSIVRSMSDDVVFYSIQAEDDAARLLAGGAPWPTGPSRAHLGPGFYAWGDRAAAEAYMAHLGGRGASGMTIVEARFGATDYARMVTRDLTSMTDEAASAWLGQFSGVGEAGVDHVIRETGRFGVEHRFGPDAFVAAILRVLP